MTYTGWLDALHENTKWMKFVFEKCDIVENFHVNIEPGKKIMGLLFASIVIYYIMVSVLFSQLSK